MTSTTAPRARLATRFVALLIDLVIVSGLVTLAGLALTVATDGRIGIVNAVVKIESCESGALPAGVELPKGFVAGEIRSCTRSVPGLVYHRRVVVEAKGADAGGTDGGSRIVIALDKAGRPVNTFDAGVLIVPALALYFLLLEWRTNTTPGKWLVGAEVQSLGGGPASLLQSAQRTLVRIIVLTPAMIVEARGLPEAGEKISLSLMTAEGPPDSILVGLLGWVTLAYLVATIVLAVRGSRAPHDLWAGTDVVCPGSPS